MIMRSKGIEYEKPVESFSIYYPKGTEELLKKIYDNHQSLATNRYFSRVEQREMLENKEARLEKMVDFVAKDLPKVRPAVKPKPRPKPQGVYIAVRQSIMSYA